jgi:hypothetical protein
MKLIKIINFRIQTLKEVFVLFCIISQKLAPNKNTKIFNLKHETKSLKILKNFVVVTRQNVANIQTPMTLPYQ